MPIVLDARSLFRGRVREVQVMLRPLTSKGHPIPCGFVSNPKATIICAHRGGPSLDHTSTWFNTSANEIQAQYHEIWYPKDGEHEWWLERAYFGLRRSLTALAKVEEILCIHSDPLCEDTDPLGSYKRGPHLHVSIPQSPVAKAHFPLNLGHLEEVLASCDDLSRAISLAIKVVHDEVVCRFG